MSQSQSDNTIESKFVDRKQFKKIQTLFKTVYKGATETASGWVLKNPEGEVVSQGYTLFRKVTAKDKQPDRKLICVLKYKKRGDSHWVNDAEIEDEDTIGQHAILLEATRF